MCYVGSTAYRLFLACMAGSIIWLQGCKDQHVGAHKDASEVWITSDSVVWMASYRNCNPDSVACTYMRVFMPYTSDEWLNSVLNIKVIQANSGESPAAIDSLCKQFVKEYATFVAEMNGDYHTPWYQDQKISLLYQNGSDYSFQLELSEYTGGAHGMYQKQLFMVNRVGKRVFTAHDLLDTGQVEFKRAVELYFREAASVQENQPLSDAGYTFLDESFSLPMNMCMVEEGLLCYYAAYEAGPYVLGDLEFVIPVKAIAPFMKKPIRKES